MSSFAKTSITSHVTSSIFRSLHAATMYLMRPLLSLNPSKFKDETSLLTFQLSLHSAIFSVYVHSEQDPRNLELLFDLSPLELPPSPIQIACDESGIKWSDWICLLGGTAFTLVIQPEQVYVVRGSRTTSIWVAQPITLPSAADEDTTSDADSSDSRPSSRLSSVSSFSVASSSGTSQSSVVSLECLATSHSQPVKYLYQGGQSVVLTGGVMLGCSSPATCARPPAVTSKHYSLSKSLRPGAVSRCIPPAPRSPVALTRGSDSSSWRRSG